MKRRQRLPPKFKTKVLSIIPPKENIGVLKKRKVSKIIKRLKALGVEISKEGWQKTEDALRFFKRKGIL